jgi:glutathione S-transferase
VARILYDLAGADDERRFSPNCWRVKMALAHKQLSFDARPWRFTEKEAIAFSGQGLVPVLVDGERVVVDSWGICQYLDETYPTLPLAESAQARAYALFIKHWAERVLHPAIFRVILPDIYVQVHPKDRGYFRSSREARVGTTLEAYSADRPTHLATLHQALDPLRATLNVQAFVSGSAPGLADYLVFGAFQWARCTSPAQLLESEDPIHLWRERMLALHGSLAARAPGYPTVSPEPPQ